MSIFQKSVTDGQTDGNAITICPRSGHKNVTVRSPEITRYYRDKSSDQFHEDRKINVASRVLTRFYDSHIWKSVPPPGSHVFQPTGIIFELFQDIIVMNLLTKFHEDRIVNVASRAPPLGSHVFQANIIIFEIIQDIIETNLLTDFHEDWTINVASRVLTRKNDPPMFHGYRKIYVTSRLLTSHVFQPTGIIFELVQYIIGMNLLTEFHEDRTINVASRVHIKKNAPPLGSHVFQANVTIFDLIQDINKTNLLIIFHEDWTIHVASRVLTRINLLTNFHEDWTINVASRVLTRFYYSHIRKNALPLGSHVFQAKVTIFKLIQYIIGTNLLTKFHEDQKINVASRVLTRKNAPPPGGHVFQPTGIIYELSQDIIGMNLLTKFNEDWTINVASRVHTKKNAPPLGSHVFQAKVTIFELIQDIIGKNLLSTFHEYRKINVASRVLTRKNAPPHTINVASRVHVFQANVTIFELKRHIQKTHTKNVTARVFTHYHYIHIEKTARPPGGHVFSPFWTIFKLFRDINESNVLTKFRDDWAKIVISSLFTRNTALPPGGHVFQRTGTIF
ncbi:hypothetical protein DPMN_164411 [Dreissena polymorpha]|uniref:Uncharacterized protein n=1 Tax=Dreissena polymorpha TaxID=45954 RepID=A0A9D4ITQ2_DREPO|nr:hypothetical protein DPMN_164411 [Dreissena polymorpha]